MTDEMILVDVFDNEIGYTDKADAHARGLLHRAFSVFVIHDGRMLIQKRSRNKYHSGGLWTNACCSHPRRGETLKEAVARRMKEELGFSSPVHECFHFIYRHVFNDGVTEYEFDHVFLTDYSGPYDPDPAEAEEVRWISFEELSVDLRNDPDSYTVWFLIAAPEILRRLKEDSPCPTN